MSSITEAGKDLLNTYANAAVMQGIAYAGTSCLNSTGYWPEFSPLTVAASTALLFGIGGLLDLTRKRITYFDKTTELFKNLDVLNREHYELRALEQTDQLYSTTTQEMQAIDQKIAKIEKELKLYKSMRDVVALTLTIITVSFTYDAIHSLPSMVNALASFSPIAPITLAVGTIFMTGIYLTAYLTHQRLKPVNT